MDVKLVVAVVGLFGVLLSAAVQYLLGQKSESRKNEIAVKSSAYSDLIESVTAIAISSNHGKNPTEEQLYKLSNAKLRCTLIGNHQVVTQLHEFFTAYGAFGSNESDACFSKLVDHMRNDLSSQKSVGSLLIQETIFGKKV